MKKALFLITVVILGAHPLRGATTIQDSDSAPMYVDGKAIEDRFPTITDEDMAMLRSKKILLGGQSYSALLASGLKLLGKQDKKYDITSAYHMFVVDDWRKGKDAIINSVPPDAFSQYKFVHFAVSPYPATFKTDELDSLMREASHGFGKVVDAACIYEHPANLGEYEYDAKKMEKLQADFPNVRFIYCTAGIPRPAAGDMKMIEACHAYDELMRARYKGKAPLFDMEKVLNDDFRCGISFCPEYGSEPTDGHPHLPAGQIIMAKGFLLMLRDAFRAPWPPKAELAPLDKNDVIFQGAEKIPADSPDAKAVRAILDANGLKDIKVEDVSVVKGGRIIKLYLQEIGVANLTSSIGDLTELRTLHVYGDGHIYPDPSKKPPLPLLKTIDPAIGKCAKLEDVLINDNALTSLPDSMAKLANLTVLSVAHNHLQNLSPAVADWVKRNDPQGLANQVPLTPPQGPSPKP